MKKGSTFRISVTPFIINLRERSFDDIIWPFVFVSVLFVTLNFCLRKKILDTLKGQIWDISCTVFLIFSVQEDVLWRFNMFDCVHRIKQTSDSYKTSKFAFSLLFLLEWIKTNFFEKDNCLFVQKFIPTSYFHNRLIIYRTRGKILQEHYKSDIFFGK